MFLKKLFGTALIIISLAEIIWANPVPKTHRELLINNEQVKVWKTIIYPRQELTMHRHEYPRVVIALNSGILKIADDKGNGQIKKFEKDQAYFLPQDPPNSLHTDTLMGNKPLKIVVVELKK